jgi:hypothetical protein
MSRLEINPFLARFSAFRALTNGQQYLIGGIIFLATHFLWNGILRGVGMGSQAVPVVNMLQILCIPCALFYSPPRNYGVADEAASTGIAGNRGEQQVQANVASQSRPPMHVSSVLPLSSCFIDPLIVFFLRTKLTHYCTHSSNSTHERR